jgi:hypothetical protein
MDPWSKVRLADSWQSLLFLVLYTFQKSCNATRWLCNVTSNLQYCLWLKSPDLNVKQSFDECRNTTLVVLISCFKCIVLIYSFRKSMMLIVLSYFAGSKILTVFVSVLLFCRPQNLLCLNIRANLNPSKTKLEGSQALMYKRVWTDLNRPIVLP